MLSRLILASALLASATSASATITKLNFAGSEVSVTDEIPPEVRGEYTYEQKADPRIKLNADRTGSFEPHQRPGIPVKYWMLADEGGKPSKIVGAGTANYGYTIILQYGPGGDGNYPEGGIDGWQWVMNVSTGCAVILGERYKCS